MYRKIGFWVLFTILAGIVLLCLILGRDIMLGPHLMKVAFPNVGTLILQEPVVMDGVEVGSVSEIEFTPEKALVTLEFYRRIRIPVNSEIINFNHSMMGSRMIFIQRGNSTTHMDMNRIHQGVFREGIGELLTKTRDVLSTVARYRQVIQDFHYGTDSSVSFLAYYNEKLQPFVAKCSKLTGDLQQSAQEIQERAEKAIIITAEMASYLEKSGRHVNEIIQSSLEILRKLNLMLDKANTQLANLNSQYERLQAESDVMKKLLYEKDIFNKLKQINALMSEITKAMGEQELSEMINFWRNIRIMGKNPNKKALRQKQSP